MDLQVTFDGSTTPRPAHRWSVTVHVAGDVDLVSADQLRQALADTLSGGVVVAVDLSAVAFIDAARVGGLAHAADLAQQMGAELSLRQPSDPVRRTIAIVDTHGFLALEG